MPLEAIKGFYKLKASLLRLGLHEVAELPVEPMTRRIQAARAISLTDPKSLAYI